MSAHIFFEGSKRGLRENITVSKDYSGCVGLVELEIVIVLQCQLPVCIGRCGVTTPEGAVLSTPGQR